MRLSNLDGRRGVFASSRGGFDLIHSVDSLELVEEKDRRGGKRGRPKRCYLAGCGKTIWIR